MKRFWKGPNFDRLVNLKSQTIVSVIGHNLRITNSMSIADFKRFSVNNSYSFAFIRHPFERLLSAYQYLTSLQAYSRNAADTQDLAELISPYGSFRKLVTIGFRESREHLLNQIHLRPQHLWIRDEKGSIAVNFLGRFEHLPEDWERVQRLAQIDIGPLPHLNRSIRDSIVSNYSKELESIVEDVYAEDFELFESSRTGNYS